MLCNEFDARVQKLLDERRSPEFDSDLLSHAEHCSTCHSQLATLTRLFDSLDILDVPDLPSDFAQRVVDSVNKPTLIFSAPNSSTSRAPAMWPLLAFAATLLLATIPLSWYALNGPQIVAQPTSNKKPTDALDQAGSARHAPSTSSVASGGWLVTGATILELYPEEVRQRHRLQVTRIADDLRPIATPFNAALTAIRRSIPLSKRHTKGEPRASVDRPLRTPNLS